MTRTPEGRAAASNASNNAGMAGDQSSDYDRLLAEVEANLGDKPVRREPGKQLRREPAEQVPVQRADAAPVGQQGGLQRRARTAAVAGVTGAAAVFVIFAVLPFLGAISGAIGAGLATFVAVFLLRRR